MTSGGHNLDVLVKVDVGFHRCGVDPESSSALETIKDVAALPGLSLRGLLSHAGQAYNAGSIQELGDIATKEIGILRSLAAGAKSAGVEIAEISVGSTPT